MRYIGLTALHDNPIARATQVRQKAPRDCVPALDPSIERLIGARPLGFSAGDANLYRYVHNAPTRTTDPTGLARECTILDGLQRSLDAEHDRNQALLDRFARLDAEAQRQLGNAQNDRERILLETIRRSIATSVDVIRTADGLVLDASRAIERVKCEPDRQNEKRQIRLFAGRVLNASREGRPRISANADLAERTLGR
jgi:hypothetical protein